MTWVTTMLARVCRPAWKDLTNEEQGAGKPTKSISILGSITLNDEMKKLRVTRHYRSFSSLKKETKSKIGMF